MYLPPEIHDLILRYLDRQDIALYRLVGRSFAIAGAPPLFERLHFRTSLESLQRLAHISKRECGRHVKHLLWNTSGAEFEARAFMEGLRTRELKYILGQQIPSTPTRTGTAGGVELSPSLGVFLLGAIFAGFPNLKSLYVLTSRSSPSAFGNDGWAQRMSLEPEFSSDHWPLEWKASHGCPRCRGLCQAVVSTGTYEMQAGALAAYAAGHPLTGLRVEHLNLWMSPAGGIVPGYDKALAYITSLELVLGMRKKNVGCVQQMLRATPRLRMLKLWLNSASWWADVDHEAPLPNLKDMFPGQAGLPALRELEVHQLDVAQDFLESFLLNHAGALRVLKMHRMKLSPKGSWPALFTALRGRLNLELIWFCGDFEGEIGQGPRPGWNMDEDDGREMERWLLERSG